MKKPPVILSAAKDLRPHGKHQISFAALRITCVIALLFSIPTPAKAEQPPLEISAATALEWNRLAKTYTARGDVIATRGTAEIRSATLTAAYAEDKSGTAIKTLTAEGNVTISSPPYTAFGDKAVYNAVSGDAVLTGKDLKIIADNERLTAKDALRYSATNSTFTAEGNATAVKGTQTLMAETLTAHFTKNAKGESVTEKITATGRITLTTAKETITGDTGFYDVINQTANIEGNVKITQDRNTLTGTKAVIDMKSGLSRLTANQNTGGRVKGTFYPAQ